MPALCVSGGLCKAIGFPFDEVHHFLLEESQQNAILLYSRKFLSAKNFVKSDRRAIRQEFIFINCRSSLACFSVAQSSLFCLSFILTFMNISGFALVVLRKI